MSNLTANNPYCYAVRIPGGWAQVNHSFTEWAVGDFIAKGGKQNGAAGK